MPSDRASLEAIQIHNSESADTHDLSRDSEISPAVTLQEAATRLASLSQSLRGQVSPETAREIEFFAEFALATAKKHLEIEGHFEELKALQEARTRAVEALVTSDKKLAIPLGK